jgi:hypothetical protein
MDEPRVVVAGACIEMRLQYRRGNRSGLGQGSPASLAVGALAAGALAVPRLVENAPADSAALRELTQHARAAALLKEIEDHD